MSSQDFTADDPLNAQPSDDDEEEEEEAKGGDTFQEADARWLLRGIGADFRSIASSLQQTASGVASFVHQSAVTVAHEISRLEEEEEELASHAAAAEQGDVRTLRLPWELPTAQPGEYREDVKLREQIMRLSETETTFLEPYRQTDESYLDRSRIDLIRQLLLIDPCLSHMQSQLVGVQESAFWRNYFEACARTRRKYLKQENMMDELDFVCVSSVAGMKSLDSLVLVESKYANIKA